MSQMPRDPHRLVGAPELAFEFFAKSDPRQESARRRTAAARSNFRRAIWRPVISASPLSRISTDCEARMLAIARALPSSFLRSRPDRAWVMLRCHPDVQAQRDRIGSPDGLPVPRGRSSRRRRTVRRRWCRWHRRRGRGPRRRLRRRYRCGQAECGSWPPR